MSPMDPSSIWATPTETTTYRTESTTFEDMTFTVIRRSLSFPEETRILAKVIDPATKRPDTLEMLALTFGLTVKENNFGLTVERIRTELPGRPALAWFLIKWLCKDTLKNISQEELTKKSGP